MLSRIAVFCVALCFLLIPNSVSAVVIELHGSGKTIHGRLVRLTPESLVIDQVNADGDSRRREFVRADIAKVTLNVSDERLAQLDPSRPEDYLAYAEELRPLQEDPDAHLTAIRLYLIAGFLAPDQYGDQVLRRLIELARNRSEERRLRAMLFIRESKAQQNRSLSDQRSASMLSSNGVNGLLACLRALRTGNRRKARAELDRDEVRQALLAFPGYLTSDQLQEIIYGQCSHCLDGQNPCDRCNGEGIVTTNNGQMPCPNCGGSKLVRCASCRGRDFFTRPSDEQMRKILSLELEISEHQQAVDHPERVRGLPKTYRNWTTAYQQSRPALMILDWENISEFDPAQSVYVGDRWVRP